MTDFCPLLIMLLCNRRLILNKIGIITLYITYLLSEGYMKLHEGRTYKITGFTSKIDPTFQQRLTACGMKVGVVFQVLRRTDQDNPLEVRIQTRRITMTELQANLEKSLIFEAII